jgi:tetratricopeptide (TPR) repeat protein
MDRPSIQPPFVGESRFRLVDGLLAVLTEVETRGETRWVSLESPSGWGKTRVAQELYVRLAARETEGDTGRYWPATILETVPEASLDQVGSRRKRVYPRWIDRGAASLPSFFWWGIACDMRSDGTATEALLADLRQIEAHALYLEAAWAALDAVAKGHLSTLARARRSIRDALRSARKGAGKAAAAGQDEIAGHLIGNLIADVLGTAIPGGGILAQLGRLAVGKALKETRDGALIAAGGRFDLDKPPDILDGTVALVARLARPGLPFVLFVEDLHRATPLVEELIERLVRSNAAILIVTSTWPGEIEARERLAALTRDPIVGHRCLRLRHDQPLPEPFPAGASLDALPTEALAELVLAYYPGTAPEVVAHLAARYNNPLPLELVCNMAKLRRAFAGRPLGLTPAQIDALPDNDVHALYRALWEELPETAQQALALATLAIPEDSAAWHNRLTGEAIAACTELADCEAVAETLGQDRVPHGWARAVQDWLRRFNEPDQLRIAEEERASRFFEHEIEAVCNKLGEQIRTRGLTDIDSETQYFAWLALTLHRNGKGGITDFEALGAIRVLQQALADQPRELPARLALGTYLTRLELDPNSVDLLSARSWYAETLGESGRAKAAVAALAALLPDQNRVLGPDHPDTLTTRHNMAYWRAESGEISTALADFEDLLGDKKHLLGSDHPDTLTLRHNIAYWRAKCGRIALALVDLETLLQEQRRILGADHPETLGTRHNIASWQAELGETASALANLESLLADLQRVHGPDHPHALKTRHEIASRRAKSGEIAKALADFETLLACQQRILGSEHIDTLTTRGNIARWRAESGEIAAALTAFESLLADHHHILGPDHPDTLTTRHYIAYWRAESGEVAAALSELATLLRDYSRILGPEHPETLKTRNNIASWRAESGEIAAALADFETLLADQALVLDPGHPELQRTRNWIADLRERLETQPDPPET